MSEIETIALDRLVVSPLNERTTEFDPDAGGQNIVDRTKAKGDVDPPLKVRPTRSGDSEHDYEIVDGSRRYNSALEAGLDACSVIVEDMTDVEAMKETVASNVSGFQKSVTVQERAGAMRRLWREMGNKGIESARILADEVGVSEDTARDWLEPLRREWEGTFVYPELSDNGEMLQTQEQSDFLDDVSGRTLREIRTLEDTNSEERLTIVRRVENGDLSASEVKETKRSSGNNRRTVERLLGNDPEPEPDSETDDGEGARVESDGGGEVDIKGGSAGGLVDMIGESRIIEAAKQIHADSERETCPVCGGDGNDD